MWKIKFLFFFASHCKRISSTIKKKRLLYLIFFFICKRIFFSSLIRTIVKKNNTFWICNEYNHFIQNVSFKIENENVFETKFFQTILIDIRNSKKIFHWFVWFQIVSIVKNIEKFDFFKFFDFFAIIFVVISFENAYMF